MRPSGLKCACSPRQTLPLDHFSFCPKPPMPLPRLAGILQSVLGDKTHRDGRLTATRLLTCPRQVVIEDAVPMPFDPTSYNSIYDGVVEHEAMQRHAPPGTYAEIKLPLPGQPKPRLFGVELEGTPDFVTADLKEIHDYKKHSETAQRFRHQRGGADPEVAAQMNIYRLMLEQCVPGAKVERLIVWHGAMVSAGGPPAWFSVSLPLMNEEQIASMKPHGGELTVQQIVDAYVHYAADNLLPSDAEVGLAGVGAPLSDALAERIRKVPLGGRKMWGGKKCTLYCGAREVCDRIEGVTRL